MNIRLFEKTDAIAVSEMIPPLFLMKGGGLVHASSLDENGHRISKWIEY